VDEGWPVGLLTLDAAGTVLDANAALLGWVGRAAQDVVGHRIHDLLAVGGRIFWETHLAPLLVVERRLDEVALELSTASGRLPVLVSALAAGSGPDAPVRVAVTQARERVRYEREIAAARAAAEGSAERIAALQAVTAALVNALGVSRVAAALADAAVGPLGAASATVWVPDAAGRLLPRVQRGGAAGEAPGPTLLSEGRPVRDADRVVIPLRGQARLRGVLAVVPSTDAAAEPLDLDVLEAVGRQAGLALDRAVLFEHNADVARELQHSLLAVEPPVDPRFEVSTTYRPGVEMLEVGGDWHDTFVVDSGVIAVVVGDVVGRGLAAASAMGQLRSAVRAVAEPGAGPASVLARLDRFVEQVEAASMATLAYAELDLATGALRFGCAGHPPPVLLPAAGDARLLWAGRSTPLGAYGRHARAEAETAMAPGDRLLLYTDGLVERRDRGLDERLALLVEAADRTRGLPLADAVRSLSTELLSDEQGRDDVCTLLVEWRPAAFERELPGDLNGLRQVRADLSRWLGAKGVTGLAADEVVLATSEALANAVEHGTEGGGRVHLRVECSPGDDAREIVVRVKDDGGWRTRPPAHDRGRGLALMRGLMDDVMVRHDGGTTVELRRRVARRVA
jgi:anti-sigma regulatory factor (Ser/Thr protein kinase)